MHSADLSIPCRGVKTPIHGDAMPNEVEHVSIEKVKTRLKFIKYKVNYNVGLLRVLRVLFNVKTQPGSVSSTVLVIIKWLLFKN